MAGNTLLSLLVKLGLDSAELDSGLAKTESSVSSRMKNIGSSMMKTGGLMTAGLTLPIVAAGVKMGALASDMEESINKVNVVFGESAGEIQSWAKTAATSLGMSSQQALEAAGTYGNLFRAMGLGLGPAADMSKAVVGLAADLASFNNASPEETLLALRSGLSGEMMPLKRFGVAMNDTTMKNMAMSMGLGDNILALSEAEKVQVRYAVIMSQTSLAQGDFIRTSDGMANTTKILKARLVDVAAALGAKLLPLGLKLATLASDLVGKFSSLTSGQQNMILIVVGVVAAIGPLTTIIGALSTALGAVIPLFTGLITAMKVYSMQTSVVPLTNALTVAFGAQAVAIGAAAAALVALIAVGYTYHKQIIVRQKEGIEANTEAWKNLYSAMEGAGTAAIMAKYTRTIGNMNKAYKDSNAIARLFVDLQGLEFTGFRDLERVLVTTTSNYEDYVKQLRTAAALQGLTITDTGQLIRMVDNFDGTLEEVTVGVLQYTEGLYDATRSAEGMTAATVDMAEKLRGALKPAIGEIPPTLEEIAAAAKLLHDQLMDETAWEVMYTSAKDATERVKDNFDWLGQQLTTNMGDLSVQGAQLWNALLVSTGRISPEALTAFLQVQQDFLTMKTMLEKGIAIPVIVNWYENKSLTGPAAQAAAAAATAAAAGDWVRRGPSTTPGKTGGWWENTVTGYWEERALGGAFKGWAMVGDTPSGGITPYTEWVYGSGVVYNQSQMARMSAGIPDLAGGGVIGAGPVPPAQPVLDEAKLARMIRDAILQSGVIA